MTNQKIRSLMLVVILSFIAITVATKTVLETLDKTSSGNIEKRNTHDPLETELSNLVARNKDGSLDVIDISAATTFSWDRLYMFGPYTSPDDIDAIVGRSWRKSCYTQIYVSDGFIFLVFTDNKTVVHCLDYPKTNGNFLLPPEANNEGFSLNESRFRVNETGDLIWIGNN